MDSGQYQTGSGGRRCALTLHGSGLCLQTVFEDKVQPAFIDGNGRWLQEGLQDRAIFCAGQPLTSTGTLDGSKGAFQAPKAISAVHSYNDMSPVLTAE